MKTFVVKVQFFAPSFIFVAMFSFYAACSRIFNITGSVFINALANSLIFSSESSKTFSIIKDNDVKKFLESNKRILRCGFTGADFG